MKLIKLEIIEFGALHDYTLEFNDGLNIIEGQNESGKSTILAFIRFMLYGFAGRAGGTEPSDKERYLSWTGGRAVGSMTLSTADGRIWRIEREGTVTHTARGDSYSEKPVRIFDGQTGEMAYRGQCPGELFLGLSTQAFNSTCAVSQLRNTEINAGELGSSIENMLRTADEGVSVPKVCKRLEDARRELLHKTGRGGKIYELKCERERLEEQLRRSEDNARSIIELEAQLGECRRKTERASAEQTRLDEIWERSEAWLILGRFDRQVSEAAELEVQRKALSELENTTFPDSFIPPDDYSTTLTQSAERVIAADNAVSQADLRYRQHTSIPTYDEHLAAIAEKMEASGLTKALVTQGYDRRVRLLSRRRALGTMALLVGGVSLAAGLVLWLALNIVIPGLAIAGIGAVMAIAGAVTLATSAKARRDITDFIAPLELDSDPGAAGLARYIDDCLAAEKGKLNHMSAARALSDVCNTRRHTLENELSRAQELLAPFGLGADKDAQSIYDTMQKAAADCRRFTLRRNELMQDISARQAQLERLTQSLEGYDKQFLRQKAERLDRAQAISDEEHRSRREQCAKALREAYDDQTALERRIAFAEAQEISPARVSAQLDAVKGELARLMHKAEAIDMALNAINSASVQLRRGFTPALRQEAQKLLSVLTDGGYCQLGIADDFALSTQSDGSTRSVALLSGGTRDAIYLSLRLALTRLLCRDEPPPVLLDEALAQLDDIRAARMLDILSGWCRAGGQCLLFTCHSRESNMAREAKVINI